MGTQQVGHTPGKWRMSSLDPRCNKHESEYKVFMEDSGYVLVCGANQEANARLIASAPGLAAVVLALVGILDAADGRLPLAANQGQAMDGYTELANYRALGSNARAALVAAGLA